MAVLKRRLWLALAAISLLVLALGIWLYMVVFLDLEAALERAETFVFRRMTVAQLAERGVYRFFFVTNRRSKAEGEAVEERFGIEVSDALTFGSFDTRIKPTLGIGMIINPTEWFQNKAINLQDVATVERAAFVAQLRDQVQASPYRSVLVVVHGFREAFPSALRKTAFLGHVLDINTPVLVFDWPGNQGTSLRGYRRAQRVAKESGAELAAAIEMVIRDVRPERLWLVANSMGAQVVTDAFSLLSKQADLADAETEIEHVILTAPDVDRDAFDQRFKREISALADQLTVYVSSNDRALLMSRIVNWGRRRGESTLDVDQLEEAIQVVDLIEPDSQLITLVDVTPVNRTRNFHNFSLETPEFFDDLFLRLTNPGLPRSRLLYKVETPDGKLYWVLTRGR
ncbi:MAG: alpha/beta fold hydrolase [Kiloniellales bacterium]|nr:alpha/beta fold hydrolase [Kiloniellales bacterium]